jgi:hypothetical protein
MADRLLGGWSQAEARQMRLRQGTFVLFGRYRGAREAEAERQRITLQGSGQAAEKRGQGELDGGGQADAMHATHATRLDSGNGHVDSARPGNEREQWGRPGGAGMRCGKPGGALNSRHG